MSHHQEIRPAVPEQTVGPDPELAQPAEGQPADKSTLPFMRRVLMHVRSSKLVGALPVISRFAEVSSACACGSVCPTCIGITAGSLVLPRLVEGRGDGPDDTAVRNETLEN